MKWKKNRDVVSKDVEDAIDSLRRSRKIIISKNGMKLNPQPMLFGFEISEGKMHIYVRGKRIPGVCIGDTVDVKCESLCRNTKKDEGKLDMTLETVTGKGVLSVVIAPRAAHARDLLVEHCNYGGTPAQAMDGTNPNMMEIVFDQIECRKINQE